MNKLSIKLIWEEKKPRRGLSPSKRAVLVQKYSEGRCFSCEKKFDYLNLNVHHIKPLSKGGSNKLTNLTILCVGCHRAVHQGVIDSSTLKPMMKPKPKKPKKPKKKKSTDLFQLPKIKLPKGYV